MDTNNLPAPRPILGSGVRLGDLVVNHSDDSLKCSNCEGWLADHVRVLWAGEELVLCSGQREDLDTYQSRAEANRDHAIDVARYRGLGRISNDTLRFPTGRCPQCKIPRTGIVRHVCPEWFLRGGLADSS